MKKQGIDRRDFIKAGALLGAGFMAVGALPSIGRASSYTPVKYSDVMDMGPEDMAKASGPVTASMRYIEKTVASIRNPVIRSGVQSILDNPAPTIMEGLGTKEKKEVYEELSASGMVKDVALEDFLPQAKDAAKSPQPFLSAPGSGYGSHHAYPGGVVTHTALNLRASLALYEGYRDIYDYLLDRDVVIASQALHDLHKPWVFQWQDNGESRTELSLAGTGEHHTLSVAESFYRGLPASVCIAQACAHNHPGFENDEKGPVNWISTAAKLIGKDAAAEGWLAPDGSTLPQPRGMENFVCHLGDHDWILTVPAAHWMIPQMKEIAVQKYGLTEADLDGKKFNQLRNYVFSQATIMGLYHLYASQGKDALTDTVLSIVTPA
ncbi:metal-dependent phosphohydrolase [Oceanidesulfovibrio marinus]|uniref:Metal-dependent phosphohydrolase n=1 Tax=Oceanidesulfovibrio marinus TaxID=370038 RepID=A0A6P1ZM87_9BACT|nr:metal-dependent phosphohydrolase [Oceanidesulfovibrio marinus]QJT08153.1 metal-dependent phosphohydrolase [Oceanidesulfovibrio marinus]TVM35049.1 metal-dependent phosphohydrolase [Oceanidesulfovibrio marinus]